MSTLSERSCEACNSRTRRLFYDEAAEFLAQLKGWQIVGRERLEKYWSFGNFTEAFKFVKAVSEIAEREGHHPEIRFGWDYVEIHISTYTIRALTTNDFILAAKIDELSI